MLGVPAVGRVAHEDVLGEGNDGVIFDRDTVVVINEDEIAQVLGTCE